MRVRRPDLLPHTPVAMELKKLIRDSINMSYRRISENFPVWDSLEEQYRAYRPVDEDDVESLEKHGVKKIIVPVQFATLQALTTFMMEVFTSLKPVLRVRGTDPASVRPARIQELLLDYDYRGNRGYLLFQQWFLNAGRYGYGIVENTWGRDILTKKFLQRQPSKSRMVLDGIEFEIPGAMELAKGYFTTFEGNKWNIVDNRAWFPDPRVPLSRFQDGKFCGHRSLIHWNDLVKFENDGLMFNIDEIRARPGNAQPTSARHGDQGQEDNRRSRISPQNALAQELTNAKKNHMHLNEKIIIELIPRDYDLADEDEPEFWLFHLIDDAVITRAEPSPFYRFNYEIVETFPDLLAEMSFGLMELTEPLSRHLDFIVNSHLANVRKAINDTLLVDPSRVDLRDLLDPQAGKVIRMLPRAYGQDPSAALKQLQVVDVTAGHLNDAKLVLDLWQRITGVTDQMHGQVTASKRTAFELQGVFKAAASRMKMLADLASAEGIGPLTEQMSLLRQENMTEEQFVELVGYSANDLGVRPDQIVEGFLKVQRDHIQGNFHFPAEEGVLPQDRGNASQILMKVFETVARAPFLAQIFDPVEIFKETIRQSGIHNIDDFMRKGIKAGVQILPPEMISEMLARGRLQPGGGTSGVGAGRPDTGVVEDSEGLSLNGALNGAGRTHDQRTTS